MADEDSELIQEFAELTSKHLPSGKKQKKYHVFSKKSGDINPIHFEKDSLNYDESHN